MELAAILTMATTVMPIVALGAIAFWVLAVILKALYNFVVNQNRGGGYPVYVQPQPHRA
jgi:hypothetical protein